MQPIPRMCLLFSLIIFILIISRHDEWIGHERIIGHEKTAVRGVKQTRTRTIKEPTKSIKPTSKPTAKPVPKPAAKKNGKNASGHSGRPCGSKARKRTPSPTMNNGASSRNGNGRACKTRKDDASDKAEPSSDGQFLFFENNLVFITVFFMFTFYFVS